MVEFDPARVACSRFGAYLAIAYLPASESRAAGLYLRTLHGAAPHREICRIDLLHAGHAVAAHLRATPCSLQLESEYGSAELCFDNPQMLRARCSGVELRFSFSPGEYDHAVAHPLGWEINCFSNRLRLALAPLSGTVQVYAPTREGSAQELTAIAAAPCEVVIAEFRTQWPVIAINTDFAHAAAATAAEFQCWLDSAPVVAPHYTNARELAAYVQWSAVVRPSGNFHTPAMLMSKNWLSQVWSWDHCFNAMALVDRNPALAWDQFMLPFAQQNAEGALPDCFSDETITWNFTKPPLHGWALAWLLQRSPAIGDEQLRAIYAPLVRWTEWWLRYRDDNGNGIAQYNHGNESGWDNCTLFDIGAPLETPDLSAFLVLQMETLADIAGRLQMTAAAQAWRQRAQQLLQAMLDYFWRDDGFVAIDTSDGSIRKTETLLLLIPAVLGKRLPELMRAALLARLQQPDFLTACGCASESIASAAYRADGYWRGPVWAPAQLLIVSGLLEMGEYALADEISRRFCDTVARNGMAENFDAQTGAGLRDPAHTWTASVFLILANRLAQQDSAAPIRLLSGG